MASSSVALVKGYLARVCPGFVAALGSRPQFIVHDNLGSDIPTRRLFMRSTHANWSAHSRFEAIRAACTAFGKDRFDIFQAALAESCFVHAGRVLIGPVSAVDSTRVNMVTAATPLKTRISEGIVTHRKAGIDTPHYTSRIGLSAADMDGTAFVAEVRRVFGLLGISLGQMFAYDNPLSSVASLTYGGPGMLSAINSIVGPGKLVVGFRGWVNGADTKPGRLWYMVAERSDDTCGFVDVGEWTATAASLRINYMTAPYDWINGNLGTGLSNPPYLAEKKNFATLIASPKASDAFTVDSLSSVDVNWLPLIGIEREQTYLTHSLITDVSTLVETEPDYDVITITCNKGTSLGSIPVSWYVDYANKAIAGGASNKQQLQNAIDSLAENAGTTLAYAEQPAAVMLPVDIVKQTTLYRDYAKAREKSCEENDFMTKEFTTGMTYETLNTKINGSRSTKIFYGYREAGIVDAMVAPVNPYDGLSLTGGAETVTSRTPGGQFGPTFSAANAEDFVAALAQGAKMVVGTPEAQFALWGLHYGDAQTASAGLKEAANRLEASKSYGTAASLFDFRWGSVGITGYPLYNEVDTQTGYRMAMLSKGVLQGLGAEFRKIHLSKIAVSQVSKDYPSV